MAIIVASILSADFTRLGEELAAVERAGADWVHVDVMDGHFVPNLAMGPMTVEAVRRSTSLPIDVHLMIEEPDLFVERFATAGATHMSVHAEATIHLIRSLELIRSCGCHPGIALGPAAPLSLIEWSLDHADYVDLLSVNPGFGGQDFQPSTLVKVRALGKELRRRGLATIIECDGGIGPMTIPALSAAGVEAFVIGSALFAAADYGAVIGEFREKAAAASPMMDPRVPS